MTVDIWVIDYKNPRKLPEAIIDASVDSKGNVSHYTVGMGVYDLRKDSIFYTEEEAIQAWLSMQKNIVLADIEAEKTKILDRVSVMEKKLAKLLEK